MKISNRFTLKKRARKTRKNVEQAQKVAANALNRYLVRRWSKLRGVRRFVIGWLALVSILGLGVIIQSGVLKSYYLEEAPLPGGVYREGVAGKFNNLNPIFSVSTADRTVTKLVFSSLFKYDQNNKLVGNLAKKWQVSEDGIVYTVKLRNDVYWHDGYRFTADDVVFTYRAIQSPDTASPLLAGWRGIEIKALDEYTVSFKLPNEHTPFPHSLTNGIAPKHLLGDIPLDELRASDFNFSPVGTGPFVFSRLFTGEERSQVNLTRNENYHNPPAYIEEFVVMSYEDRAKMLDGFKSGELSAITLVQSYELDELSGLDHAVEMRFPLFSQVYIFLNNKDPLLRNVEIRRALVFATDKSAIFQILDGRYPISNSPLLKEQLGYNSELVQPKVNTDRANELLDKAGWKRGKDGIRVKGDEQLTVDIVSRNSGEYPKVLAQIQKDWLRVGVVANLSLVDDQEFTQNYISTHNHQALLFAIAQGVDPDPFPYWHSSQATPGGFNLSNYKSAIADDALEAGRTRSDPELRVEKYRTFLEQWMEDSPAIVLYRPAFTYVTRDKVRGIEVRNIVTPADRFNDVTSWFVQTQLVKKEL